MALEQQGVLGLGEDEILALCDSIDPERCGRVRLSDISDSLGRGMMNTGSRSAGEVREGGVDDS